MSANGLPAQLEISMTEAATKQPGKIQQLFGVWEKAGDGELLPRAFAIELDTLFSILPGRPHQRFPLRLRRRMRDAA